MHQCRSAGHFLGWPGCIGGHRLRPSCRRYLTSDIDISYSDIGTKYVGLNPHIPISEEFRFRHQLPFRYRTKSISDIPISELDKSIPNDSTKLPVMIVFSHWFWTHNLYGKNLVSNHCATRVYKHGCQISDIGQKFIPISNMMSDSAHFSPISDISISGSVRHRWSRISDWVPTYAWMYQSLQFRLADADSDTSTYSRLWKVWPKFEY